MFLLCSHRRRESLGEAWKLDWRVRDRRLLIGPKPKSRDRTTVWCDTTAELDMKTLVCTRGERMPLETLRERLKCHRCGNRQIPVYFEVPNQPAALTAAHK